MSRRKYHKMDKSAAIQESMPENLRIYIDQVFRNFLQSDELDYTFSSDLNNLQRKYIHEKAKNLSLISKSYGKEPNRQLRISKKSLSVNHQTFFIKLCSESEELIESVLSMAPDRGTQSLKKVGYNEKNFGKLIVGKSTVAPEPKTPPDLLRVKRTLPVYEKCGSILNTIRDNQVVIISSETGSGKSTQIPQYIMEELRMRNELCRIVCTQPRRISAVSIAMRVAEERGETIGTTVGYHIRLESKMSFSTNLIYVTNGVLVRTIMSGKKSLDSYTHVIIDEVHERDKLSDFLLICLRDYIKVNPRLRLILMSATVNINKFTEYFENAKVIEVPGRLYPITEYFLDDILPLLQYESFNMKMKLQKQQKAAAPKRPEKEEVRDNEETQAPNPEVDVALDIALQCDTRDSWDQLFVYFYSEEVSVNYQHSQSGLSALMVAAYHGNADVIMTLLGQWDADRNLKDSNGKTALDFARDQKQEYALTFLNYLQNEKDKEDSQDAYDVKSHLQVYDMTVPDDTIDYDLVVEILLHIHNNLGPGAVLIFLPGYDDIMICSDRVTEALMPRNSYKMFYLHGSMGIGDQHEVFKHLPDKRKIILSTNVAETSLTIDDVVYVIDTGKAKEKTYDAFSGIGALQTQWISKSCIKQRTGRAGRTKAGYCFHIFSKQRYQSFVDERTPEILRVPLEELCLHTKSIVKNEVSIESFLEKAPNPPSTNSIRVAVESLQALGAMDENEMLTPLGEYLGQLTIEPHLGKMLVYAVIFKCLDPILTLVASMAYKDPFQLPHQAGLRNKAVERRKSLTQNVLSDHLVFLKVFSVWQDHLPNRQNEFYRTYFINKSTMEMILLTRSQLMGQLRAAGFIGQTFNTVNEVNFHSKNWPLVKAVICCGLYPKIAFPIGNIIQTRSEKKVSIHSSSCMAKLDGLQFWMMFDELIKVRQHCQIRGVTAITPITVPLMCGNESTKYSDEAFNLDRWLDFDIKDANKFMAFKNCISSIVEKLLSNPMNKLNDFENKIMVTLVQVLLYEEMAAKLSQAHNFGNKPKVLEPPKARYATNIRLRPMFNECVDRTIQELQRTSPSGCSASGRLSSMVGDMSLSGESSNAGKFGHVGREFQNSKYQKRRPIVKTSHRGQENGLTNNKEAISSSLSPTAAEFNPSTNAGFGQGPHQYNESLKNEDFCYGECVFTSDINQYAGPSQPPWLLEDNPTPISKNCDPRGVYILVKANLCNRLYASYISNQWCCSPPVEQRILCFNYRENPVYFVFLSTENNSFGGIARLVSVNICANYPMSVIMDWVFKNVYIPLPQCSSYINWMRNSEPPDGTIIMYPIVEELYFIMSGKRKSTK